MGSGLLYGRFALHDDGSPAGLVGLPDAILTKNKAGCRKVWSFDATHQVMDGGVRVVDQADNPSITSDILCGGILVAIPTAIPDEPLISRLGTRQGKADGSLSESS